MKKYDLIVIGSGSGLNIIAKALKSSQKLKIALIENNKMGGTCLNRGCIPSKMLLSYAEKINKIKSSDSFFIKSKITKIDYKKIIIFTNKEIEKLSQKLLLFYKNDSRVDFFHKKAQFLDNHTLQVGNEKIYGKKIIIAVGAKPYIPKIKGLNTIDYLTYKEAMKLTKLPKDLIIIGGGYIGVELSEFFSSLGVYVTILEAKTILSNLDVTIRNEFKKEFIKKVKVFEKAQIKNIKKNKGKIVVTFDKRKIAAEKLLIATGIIANTDSIGIEKTDIKIDKKGSIRVDKYLRSNVKHIYALGDCINSYFFKHSANFEANYIYTHLFKKNKKTIKYPPIGYAVFSTPEIAGVGIKLKDIKNDRNFYIKKAYFKDTARSMATKNQIGKLLLIFDKKHKRLKGAHIVGENASILIHILIALMQKNAKEEDIKQMIFIHPTLPEVIKNALI